MRDGIEKFIFIVYKFFVFLRRFSYFGRRRRNLIKENNYFFNLEIV